MPYWFTTILFCASALFTASTPPEYSRAELLGRFNPVHHSDFERLAPRYTNRGDAYLRSEVYSAFRQMWAAAREDGIDLEVISATRNFDYQARIWRNKWHQGQGSPREKARHILRYSSMPGTSRHHWGTDFDLNALNNDYFEKQPGKAVYQWLKENAARYGFFQPYTAYDAFRDAGYREEKWHWSYFPLTRRFQRAYHLVVEPADLRGFPGDSLVEPLDVINRYVHGTASPPESQP